MIVHLLFNCQIGILLRTSALPLYIAGAEFKSTLESRNCSSIIHIIQYMLPRCSQMETKEQIIAHKHITSEKKQSVLAESSCYWTILYGDHCNSKCVWLESLVSEAFCCSVCGCVCTIVTQPAGFNNFCIPALCLSVYLSVTVSVMWILMWIKVTSMESDYKVIFPGDEN